MVSNLGIRVFPPVCSASGEHQATVWLLGGSPPLRLDSADSEAAALGDARLQIAGTGRMWRLTIAGTLPERIALIAHDDSGHVATAHLELGSRLTSLEGPDRPLA